MQNHVLAGRITGLRVFSVPEFGTRASFKLECRERGPVTCAVEGDVAREFLSYCREGDWVTLTGIDANAGATLTYGGLVYKDAASALAVSSGANAQMQTLGLSTSRTFACYQGVWFQSSNGSNAASQGYYFLLSDGTLHAWDGAQGGGTASSSPVVATFDPSLYTNVTQLLTPAVATGVTATPNGNRCRASQ